MERYQIIIAYDGTDFVGSQRQLHARTVQGALETALRAVGWQGKTIWLAGRTDTGVHAAGQVAAADVEWAHSPEQLAKALNSHLPGDMVVRQVRVAPARFHPRFDATSRRYTYRVYCQPTRNPLRDRFAGRVWPAPELNLLEQAAQTLIGKKDFGALGSAPIRGGSTVRTVLEAKWEQTGEDELQFHVRADAFLYRMVRRMVFVQIAVGQQRLGVDAIHLALEGKNDLPAGLASPSGLTLVEVSYPSQNNDL